MTKTFCDNCEKEVKNPNKVCAGKTHDCTTTNELCNECLEKVKKLIKIHD